MEKKQRRAGITDGILAVVSLVYVIGSRTWFSACGPKEDGSFMTCHWAGQMVSAAAVLLLVLAVLHFAIRDGKTKSGISLSMIGIAILMLLIPGRLIGICAMEGMRCVSLLLPWTVGLSVCTILAAAADLVSCYSRMNREAHSRA